MKVQILDNFLVEYTWIDNKLEEVPNELLVGPSHTDSLWILHVDDT